MAVEYLSEQVHLRNSTRMTEGLAGTMEVDDGGFAVFVEQQVPWPKVVVEEAGVVDGFEYFMERFTVPRGWSAMGSSRRSAAELTTALR